MISFQRLLGREDEFCDLLEASAGQAVQAVETLKRMLADAEQGKAVVLHEFADTRSKNKAITEQISTMLVTRFVTPMEREDIEALAQALYKIPKIVEKFAERYRIGFQHIQDADFSAQTRLMEEAVKLVRQMVSTLRSGRDLGGIKPLQNRLQQLEAEADDFLLAVERKFYEPGFPALKAIILKDLFSLNEKVVDRCRDAGNVISHVILKNA